jgi:hypothetical protein
MVDDDIRLLLEFSWHEVASRAWAQTGRPGLVAPFRPGSACETMLAVFGLKGYEKSGASR